MVDPVDEQEFHEPVLEESEGSAEEAGDSTAFPDSPFAGGEPIYGEFPDTGPPSDGSDESLASAESEDYGALLHEMEDTAPDDSEPLLLSQEGIPENEADASADSTAEDAPPTVTRPRAVPRRDERVLTIDARDEIQTREDRDALIWHEIQNSFRTRRILTGTLDGVERTNSGTTLAVVSYKGFRVAIPAKEMMLYAEDAPAGADRSEMLAGLNRILSSRLGSEIDFVVKGMDRNARSIVASRKDAMLRKRRSFYMDTDESGQHMIYEGRVVQARVVAVAEKIIRVEVFGVECAIVARDLSWEWMGDARDHFNVGDRILVRVLTIDCGSVERLSITADVRSVANTTNVDNLKKCQPQCRYAGRITDVRNGVVYIRLNNGVNAIAHACYDLRTPGKKDDVSFAVTRLNEEQGVAIGIITRIIKQNL